MGAPAAIVTVVGERHEGKSTLLKIAAGIEAPSTGLCCLVGVTSGSSRILSERG